ncbi:MAG: response regulator [Spirochaetes bacterium]|nr:response regulator [Spirochaetota bacterium]
MALKRVLVAEDEAFPALALMMNLKSWGYEVLRVVSSGRDAIATAVRECPDILIMDIFLADEIDGIDAVREIRKTMKVPVIYLTASDDPMTLERARTQEFHDFITKPYATGTLRRSLERLSF